MTQHDVADGRELVHTGIPGLDEVLCGGVLPGACVVVEGAPGTGKTTLGLQYLYTGIRQFAEPGLIISFEEFPEELYRDAAAYGWDLAACQAERSLGVICTSPEVFLDDTMASDGMFQHYVDEIKPRRVVVDSITQMGHVADDPLELRRMVYSLRNGLKRHDLTAILTAEAEPASGSSHFERYLSDVVISLDYRLIPDTGVRVRELEVTKSRARPHRPGRHLVRIDSGGLTVLPDPAALVTAHEAQTEPNIDFVSTGAAGLDAMLRGGLVRGTTTVVAGSTGVGKTVFGLQFLMEGARRGEKCLFVSFEQTAGELVKMASSLNMPVGSIGEGGAIAVHHDGDRGRPLGFSIVEVEQQVRATRPQRVVVDSLSALAKTPGQAQPVAADIAALVALLCAGPGTVVLCDETPGLVGDFEITGGVQVSSLADNIIIMRYVELGSEMHRAVSVLKARYVDHDKEIREYAIGPGGIELMSKFDIATGLLRGSPVRRVVDDFF